MMKVDQINNSVFSDVWDNFIVMFPQRFNLTDTLSG